jgi:hypothetical protein
LRDETLWKLTIYHLVLGIEMAQSLVVALRGRLKHWWIAGREPIFAVVDPSVPAVTVGHLLFSRNTLPMIESEVRP